MTISTIFLVVDHWPKYCTLYIKRYTFLVVVNENCMICWYTCIICGVTRWRLSMMTSSNGNIFCVTGHLYGEFTGHGAFPAQRPVARSFWGVYVRIYSDVIISTMASQITSLTVYWTVYPDAEQRKHQSSAPRAFVWGIHRTKGQLRGKCFHLMTSSY